MSDVLNPAPKMLKFAETELLIVFWKSVVLLITVVLKFMSVALPVVTDMLFGIWYLPSGVWFLWDYSNSNTWKEYPGSIVPSVMKGSPLKMLYPICSYVILSIFSAVNTVMESRSTLLV